MLKIFVIGIVLVTLLGCSSQSNIDTVNSSNTDAQGFSETLDEQDIFSLKNNSVDTVKLIKEVIFGSTDSVYLDGYIDQLEVDKYNQVYLAVTRPGSVGIYVFNSEGSYKTQFANTGRGPGEYESISSMKIINNELHVWDPRLNKIGIFDLDKGSHQKDIVVKKPNLRDSLASILRGSEITPVNDGTYILTMQMFPARKELDKPIIVFYRLSNKGDFMSNSVLTLPRSRYYFMETEFMDIPFPMPFTRNSIFDITDKGEFYTAWSEDFTIKQYDIEGTHKSTLHYPYENSPLSINELNIRKEQKKVLKKEEIPDTWPAIHTLELDDEDRIWVSTITDEDSTFKWWILGRDGRVLAHFTKAGNRNSREVINKPLVVIRNGYFYSHERDFDKGIDRIIRYRILFEKR